MKYLKFFEQSSFSFRDLKWKLDNHREFFLADFMFKEWTGNAQFSVIIEEKTNTLIYRKGLTYFSLHYPRRNGGLQFDFELKKKQLEEHADEICYRNCYLDIDKEGYGYFTIEFEYIEYIEKLIETNQKFYELVRDNRVDLPEELKLKYAHLGQEYGFFDAEK
jgi:hypothetical protein